MSTCCKTFVYLEDMFYDRLQWLIHHLFFKFIVQYPTPPTSIGVINATTGDLWPQLHELFPPQTLWRQNMRIYPSFTCYYGGRPSAQTRFGVENSRAAEQRHPGSCCVTRQFPWKLLNWRELWPRPRLTAHPWRTARRANQRAPFKDATVNDLLAAPKSC